MSTCVHYLGEEIEDADLAGWEGPGWYFWDETQSHCYGPYDDVVSASLAAQRYAREVLG